MHRLYFGQVKDAKNPIFPKVTKRCDQNGGVSEFGQNCTPLITTKASLGII